MYQHRYDDSIGRRAYLKAGIAATTAVAGLGTVERARAAEDPAPSDTEIGGGEGYDNTVSPDDADVVVSTCDELLAALDGADSGETIYVEDDATIDLSARRITIPGGVTLASGRGRNGSSGALITADERASRLFQVFDDDVRITGLRFRGHQVGYYEPSGSVWSDDSLAIRAYADCEIDNCELYGWTHAGIGIGWHGSDPIPSDTHVHHCSIHDNMMSGLGYGVVVYWGDPLIEYNYFDENRHSIAASGGSGCSYEARYNVQGPTNLLFGFEMHSPGGDEIHIHHNTFELIERRDGRTTPAVVIRGTPDTGAIVENNWFYNPIDPGDDRYLDGSPIVQYGNDAGGSSWDNVALSNNHYGSDEPTLEIGHPRGGPETAQLRVYVRENGVEEHLDGATVGIDPHEGTDMSGYDGPYTAETEDGEDYDGSYALFENLPVGLYDIRATHPEYEEGVVADLELGPSGRQPPISLEPRDDDIITVIGRGETAQYEFTVDGEVEKSTEYGGTINDFDLIDGSTVTGRTTREPDSFAFTGEITAFESESPVDVLLNGEAVDPTEFGPTERIVTITGEGSTAQYEFTVDLAEGTSIEKSTEHGGTINDFDLIDDSTVTGRTTNEPDSFAFVGEIVSFDADAPVEVMLDGEPVDPVPDDSDEPDDPDDPDDPISDGQVITLEGGSEDDPTHYLFGVNERIERSDANGATIDDDDAISGTNAAGVLRGERDSYVIPTNDEITGFIALGDISIRIDGTELTADEVVPYFE